MVHGKHILFSLFLALGISAVVMTGAQAAENMTTIEKIAEKAAQRLEERQGKGRPNPSENNRTEGLAQEMAPIEKSESTNETPS